MVSGDEGKSNKQDEPLPGRFLHIFPRHSPDRFLLQDIPYLTPTPCATSALNPSGLRTLLFPLHWRQPPLLVCRLVSASHAPGNIYIASRACPDISWGKLILAEPET